MMQRTQWGSLAIEVEATDCSSLATAEIERFADALVQVLQIPMPGHDRFVFTPVGLSVVRFGDAGRLAIHTWPERNFATIDVWAQFDALALRMGDVVGLIETKGMRAFNRFFDRRA